MKKQLLPIAGLAAALVLLPALSQAASSPSCTAPGIIVGTDPAGDEVGAPATSFADIVSLGLSEPASTDGVNRLVFTYKMSDLAAVLPNQAWIVRFSTDVPPPDGDVEYFVAMITGPDATPHFIYGTDGPQDPLGETPALFSPQGNLDSASAFNADGTITLILDKSKIGGLGTVGEIVTGFVPVTNRITPSDGTIPFEYGFRSVDGTELAYDEMDDVNDYAIAGSAACSGSKSGVLGLGAMPFAMLVAFCGLAALRRRLH